MTKPFVSLVAAHHSPHLAQPFQMGPRKADGALLWRRPRENVFGSESGFALQKGWYQQQKVFKEAQ